MSIFKVNDIVGYKSIIGKVVLEDEDFPMVQFGIDYIRINQEDLVWLGSLDNFNIHKNSNVFCITGTTYGQEFVVVNDKKINGLVDVFNSKESTYTILPIDSLIPITIPFEYFKPLTKGTIVATINKTLLWNSRLIGKVIRAEDNKTSIVLFENGNTYRIHNWEIEVVNFVNEVL